MTEDSTISIHQNRGGHTEWMPDKSNKVNLVAGAITSRIIQENLQVGARLPSTRTLAKSLGVSYLTAREGMSELAKEGIVEFRHGSGTYVTRAIFPTTVAVVHDAQYDVRKTYLYNLLPGFREVIRKQGLKIDLFSTHEGSEEQNEHAEIINRWRRGELKGLLIVSRYPARQILDFIASGIPFVWIDNRLGKEPVVSVKIDSESTFFSSLSLFKKPKEPTLDIHVINNRNTTYDRERQFRQISAMRLWPREQLHTHLLTNPQKVQLQIRNLFDELIFPCGLYLIGEALLPAIFSEIQSRKLRIPEDVRLVVEYLSTSPALYPVPVTGWEWPFQQVAQEALRLLEYITTHYHKKPITQYVMPVLRQGSTAFHLSHPL